MKEFQLTLRNDKKKQYVQIAYLILLLNFLIFIYIGVATKDNKYYFIDAALVLICMAIDYFLSRVRNNKNRPYLTVGIFLVGLVWIRHEIWWAAGIIFILELLFLPTQKELLVRVNEQEILYPSFPQKKIPWKELNNVIIKDGILTIDFKNNKLIQQYLDNGKPAPEQKEFNEFCKEQLITAKPI